MRDYIFIVPNPKVFNNEHLRMHFDGPFTAIVERLGDGKLPVGTLQDSPQSDGLFLNIFVNYLGGIYGRGTIVTGRIEQGTIKTGEDVEILGLMQVLELGINFLSGDDMSAILAVQ